MSLRLYDTAARELRDFTPLVPGQVGIYICGLTTQGAPHIGHVRFAVAFDVLRRWLEGRHGYEVTLVRNVTDIDDKILARSAEAGVPWFALSYRNEVETARALDALGVLPPTYEPRATGHIPEMVELMEALVEKGHAYAAPDGSGDVYFDVKSFPEYGSLTHQRIDDMAAAEDADPRGKRDPRDFALWKGRKESEPVSASWPTPFGVGRPGWHLECSAMARRYLGDAFDIHGGGIDLRFPHHENEQAQSRAAGLGFARYWLHNAWVTVERREDGQVSRQRPGGQRVTKVARPLAVRYYLTAAHYRSTIEYHEGSLEEAEATVERIEGFLAAPCARCPTAPTPRRSTASSPTPSPRRWTTTSTSPARSRSCTRPSAPATPPSTTTTTRRRRRRAAVVAMTDVLGVNPLAALWGARSGTGADDAPRSPSTPSSAPSSRPASPPARRATSSAPTRSATAEPRPASPSRTPPRERSWSFVRGADRHHREEGLTWPATPSGAEPCARRQEGRDRRLRRPAPKRPRGQGPHAQGRRARVPPGAQARSAKRGERHSASGSRRAGRPAGRAGRGRAPRQGARARSSPAATRSSRRCAPTSRSRRCTSPAASTPTTGSARRSRLATERGIPILETPRGELDRLTDGAVHQGLALQVPPYDYADPTDLVDPETPGIPLVVALDGITDPRNLGAIIRSVAAFGGHGVVVPERRSAGMTASAWKTSAGAAARIPVAQARNLTRALEEYQKAGFFVLGLDMDGDVELPDLALATEPLVIVVGSEGKGLSRLVRRDLRPDRLDPDVLGGGVAQRRRRHRRDALRDRPPARPLTRRAADRAAHDEGPVLADRALARSQAGAARGYFGVVTTTVFMTLSAQVCLLASHNGHSQPIGRPQMMLSRMWAMSRTNAMAVPIGFPVASLTSVMPRTLRPTVWPWPPLIQRFQMPMPSMMTRPRSINGMLPESEPLTALLLSPMVVLASQFFGIPIQYRM